MANTDADNAGTVAAAPIFVDTNVLIYASWKAAPLHQHARAVLRTYRRAATSLLISRQVIREYLATLRRPQYGFTAAQLIAEVEAFPADFQILDETTATTAALLTLLAASAGVRVHDTNIVATMQVASVRHLLTNNSKDFAAFADLIEIIPLVP
jgi:predicted nucleic acid-binding protein